MLQPAAIIIGRYQPPHLGHYAIIDMVKEHIKNHADIYPNPIVIVIDGEKSSKDKKRNPLTPDDRISVMRASGRASGVKYLIAKDVISAMEKLKAAGFEAAITATGSDRNDSYIKILDKYYESGVKRKNLSLKRSELDVKPETIDDILNNFDHDTSVEFISGTLIRATVEKGDFDKFAIMTGLTENTDLAKSIFNKIKKSMKADSDV